uniref:Ras-GAP domain-containing protein n=1 Tax=Heterorhabditis bacteriophora TaxID=37862 RepID=A0A1I7XVD5_HETBA
MIYCRYTVTTTNDSGNRLTSALGGKSVNQEQPAVRIKARWQSVEILPMRAYDDFLHFLIYNYLPLCNHLEPMLSVKAKEDFATSLVRILHRQKMAKDFLCDLIMSEVEALDNDHLMFRGNSLATKAMEAYMKLVADDYLQNVLGDFVRTALSCEESCEVDPLKLTGVSSPALEKNRVLLTRFVEIAWGKIINSTCMFPAELRAVFCSLRERLDAQRRGSLADTLISSSIFLRYLCPAILSPSLFNLVGIDGRNFPLYKLSIQKNIELVIEHNIFRPRNENVPAYRSTPPTGQATVVERNRPAAHLLTNDDYVLSTAFQTPSRLLTRLNDEIGTSSSRTSEKTNSSGDVRNTDSDADDTGLLSERPRGRKTKRRGDSSPVGSHPASSGYHSNNHSSCSNSSSSSPIDRITALSITNPAFSVGPSSYSGSTNTSTHPSSPGYTNVGYRRPSPPPYEPDIQNYSYHPVYAIPPDCDTSPQNSSSKTSLPRTNPRATRNSTHLRTTVIDVTPEDWDRSTVTPREKSWTSNVFEHQQQIEIIEQQKREIERLIRENEILKRHVAAACPSQMSKEKRSNSDCSERSFDSLGSLDNPRKSAGPS